MSPSPSVGCGSFIDELGVRCMRLSLSEDRSGTVVNYECPNASVGQHTAVTMFFGRSGSALDAVGVRCGLPEIAAR